MAVRVSRIRVAPAAIASTCSSAPTSASTSASLRAAPALAIPASTASPPRFSPARYRSTASGTIAPTHAILVLTYDHSSATRGGEPSNHATHQDHRHDRAGQRLRRDARCPHRGGHEHPPPE